jgi:transcriptional regulator of acetoin/glycerol metabolism
MASLGWTVRAHHVVRCLEMSDFREELEPKKEAAILPLLASRNIEDAARVAGVDSCTLYRRMKERA